VLRNSPGPHRVIRTGDESGMNRGVPRRLLRHNFRERLFPNVGCIVQLAYTPEPRLLASCAQVGRDDSLRRGNGTKEDVPTMEVISRWLR
jgi:hypothetical protein